MTDQLTLPGISITTAGRCSVCRRPLRDPESIARGIGPICYAKQQAAAAAQEDDEHDMPLFDPPLTTAFVCERHGTQLWTNVPHTVTHHSPGGYEIGYGGSGPSELALNLCEAALKAKGYDGRRITCWKGEVYAAAWELHHPFKWAFLASMDRNGGRIEWETINQWIDTALQEGGIDVG